LAETEESYKTKLENAKIINEELTKELKKTKETIATLRENIKKIEEKECAECENKQNKITGLENLTAERDDLKNQVGEVQTENNSLAEQIATQAITIESLNSELGEAEQKISSLKKSLDSVSRELELRPTQSKVEK